MYIKGGGLNTEQLQEYVTKAVAGIIICPHRIADTVSFDFAHGCVEYICAHQVSHVNSIIVVDRIHVIDCLPHVWMLDGRIVTCKYQFF